jgi:hypothetical protein
MGIILKKVQTKVFFFHFHLSTQEVFPSSSHGSSINDWNSFGSDEKMLFDEID